MAMDEQRLLGGVTEIPREYGGDVIDVQLQPLVTVRGQMESAVGEGRLEWSHVYVELPPDPARPIASNRLISCGSFNGEFRFLLPPGQYSLHAYGSSEPKSEVIDLVVQPHPSFSIDATDREVNLGTLQLTQAPPNRQQLESIAKQEGRWKALVERFGEPAPNWHAADARGIPQRRDHRRLSRQMVDHRLLGIRMRSLPRTKYPEPHRIL